ncbi:MAG: VCBS repeat-containing protein [Planctomycetes bacterium]|nr:VCBS repeat-containing protein [Planctomycetota bacterium]MBM4113908.1 VCBS repeat-containing protein [Phycisphaerae bacterium]
MTLSRLVSAAAAALALASVSSAQIVFTNATTQFPASNLGYTENVDFGDVDGDGDFDAILAEGGDLGNDQNNIWINRGGEVGGTIGFFVDRTSTQFPAVLDQSRDIEFADIDLDGDLDIYVSNTSQLSNQSNRWWVNMGGAQGGTQGFYQDQSAARWSGLGVAGQSSIAASQVLPSTGFIDFSCDCDFGDLDNDGDLDLVHSSYGGAFGGNVPTRLFLNNGSGVFAEFNPSGYQLTGQTIATGNPGIWCQGNQASNTTNSTGTNCDVASSALDIDVGDIDGDYDLDILHGARQEAPRMFRNLLSGTTLAFRDVTGATFPAGYSSGNGHYEQEMADCDNDGDIDIYGLNWQAAFGFDDITLRNDGAGTYSNTQVLSGSGADDNEGDFLDYDNDGDLDLYVANFSGQDKLYRNNWTGTGNFSHTDVTASAMPSAGNTALDADCADLDQDGDTDVMVSNDADEPEYYFKNLLNTVDTRIPRIPNLEQAPGRTAGAAPTVVRAQVYDNASYYVTWYYPVTLEYRVAPAPAFTSVTMQASQGQIWRGLLPGSLVGLVEYRVKAVDRMGNIGYSATKSFTATCPAVATYCTAGTTTNGCNATLSSSGTPSVSAVSGFTLSVANVEGQKQGLIFYGITGRNAASWATGSSSFLCVKAPTQRMNTLNSGGANNTCTGSFAIDWRDWMAARPTALGQPLSSGQVFNGQCWFRDPSAPGTTNLSQGLEWTLCP